MNIVKTLSSKCRNVNCKMLKILEEFVPQYLKEAKSCTNYSAEILLEKFLKLVEAQLITPNTFDSFHKKISMPFDFHKFGKDFIRPIIDAKNSKVLGKKFLKVISSKMKNKENVVIFANHQTEIDPQILFILIEDEFPNLESEIIFVGGDRIFTDPMAVPLSLGCNLFTVYSKKYLNHPPEKFQEKQKHNMKTIKIMKNTLKNCPGTCICVFPSGGRDRKNSNGDIEIAKFLPQSVELFKLIATKSGVKTSFFPMAINSSTILPPPNDINIEIGEARNIKYSASVIAVGESVDDILNSNDDIENITDGIENIVRKLYLQTL